MNYPFFIARRLYFSRDGKKPVSHLAVHIATLGVCIGLAVMILTICVVCGFKNEITEKILGFGAHIEVFNTNASSSPETFPINTDASSCQRIKSVTGIESLQRVSSKFGIIKTNEDYKGIMFKGIGEDYNTRFLKQHLVSGSLPKFSKDKNENDILISKSVESEMNLKQGDKVFAYFLENSMRIRRFHIVGIYSTDMSQFDDNVVIANRYAVNRLNKWSDYQSSELEITVTDFNQVDHIYSNLLPKLAGIVDQNGNTYIGYTIKQLYSNIFDWLQLLNLNILVIIILMICLSSLTIISGLLILILEKTNTIGILKAMGAKGQSIRRIFIYYAILIVGRGILFGYAVGLGLSFVQYRWHIISLNPDKYYVGHVPIQFNWLLLILLGIGTLLISIIAIIGPSYVIARIRPTKAIKLD